MSTALQNALQGKTVSATAAPGALKEAAEKLSSLKERFAAAKENSGNTAMAAVHVAEAATVAGAAGFAEGYWGKEKLKIGGVPIRGAAGLVVGGWGLLEMLAGRGGGHQVAVGTGLVCSETTSMGIEAGRALREKKATGNAATPQLTPAQQQYLNANPGATFRDGKIFDAAGREATIAGPTATDTAELARLIRLAPGTEGDRRRAPRTRELVRASAA